MKHTHQKISNNFICVWNKKMQIKWTYIHCAAWNILWKCNVNKWARPTSWSPQKEKRPEQRTLINESESEMLTWESSCSTITNCQPAKQRGVHFFFMHLCQTMQNHTKPCRTTRNHAQPHQTHAVIDFEGYAGISCLRDHTKYSSTYCIPPPNIT